MSKTDDTGETTSNYLEKITPKDLVMFSSKTRKAIAQVIYSRKQLNKVNLF